MKLIWHINLKCIPLETKIRNTISQTINSHEINPFIPVHGGFNTWRVKCRVKYNKTILFNILGTYEHLLSALSNLIAYSWTNISNQLGTHQKKSFE